MAIGVRLTTKIFPDKKGSHDFLTATGNGRRSCLTIARDGDIFALLKMGGSHHGRLSLKPLINLEMRERKQDLRDRMGDRTVKNGHTKENSWYYKHKS